MNSVGCGLRKIRTRPLFLFSDIDPFRFDINDSSSSLQGYMHLPLFGLCWQCLWEVYGPLRVWSVLVEMGGLGRCSQAVRCSVDNELWPAGRWQEREGYVTSGAAALELGSRLEPVVCGNPGLSQQCWLLPSLLTRISAFPFSYYLAFLFYYRLFGMSKIV